MKALRSPLAQRFLSQASPDDVRRLLLGLLVAPHGEENAIEIVLPPNEEHPQGSRFIAFKVPKAPI